MAGTILIEFSEDSDPAQGPGNMSPETRASAALGGPQRGADRRRARTSGGTATNPPTAPAGSHGRPKSQVVRHKSFSPVRESLDEAAFERERMGACTALALTISEPPAPRM